MTLSCAELRRKGKTDPGFGKELETLRSELQSHRAPRDRCREAERKAIGTLSAIAPGSRSSRTGELDPGLTGVCARPRARPSAR